MKKIFIAAGLVAISMVFWSCENEEDQSLKPETKTTDQVSDDDLAIIHSQLVAVWNEIGRRIVQKPEIWNDLEVAFVENDETAIKTLLEISNKEGQAFSLILQTAGEQAEANGVEIQSLPEVCNSDCIPKMFDALREHSEPFEELFGIAGRERDGCNYYDYSAALIGCAGLGPYLYWPCAMERVF